MTGSRSCIGHSLNGALFLGFSVLDFDRAFRLLSGSLVPLSVVEGLAHDRVPGHALDVDVGHEGVRSLSSMLRFKGMFSMRHCFPVACVRRPFLRVDLPFTAH